ncbi:MAG: hypothetical protein A3F84_14485 [Candidatus Handelsmanbacteria bacterium RIFCSPLOWO2_12_FULL_64_10]|uniref:site-specific DNA-methyltransferase (adenine-specific) n=1 Tax=Handelsmanbacteria sp. (strain RIFCSPLOWO2_12_FULL_64_10) TaxID=1817868 RepID=A0A1F6C936_HANXR|nr:MAG: hypothetical protein A3F84_14485 [Candidatus Handelsmanbacteria bacterium RIFCSPLOWO2_12_FULL_64_10]
MSILAKDQRNLLSKTVLEAREVAETGAKKALHALGVDESDAPGHLTPDQRYLRRALRAQARQLGDREDPAKKGRYQVQHLTEKIAYDQWHRMLFARFLAENDLLISPQHGVGVSLDDCRELAPELGLRDAWEVAARFAAEMLPQIFRADDPGGRIELAPEDRSALQQLVTGLPQDIFLVDDALGWVYQFWQAKRKEAVNKSEVKIGADELAPVTQLFTEDYMVLFLLHNTLGAWWTAKRRAEGKSEKLEGIEFIYLRTLEDGTPAAGAFEGWPRTARELRMLDPCMGSAHFIVFALPILVAFRIEEEGLSPADACETVLHDNLFGLELDPRCTQIAAFNLALAAWKIGGYRQLPSLNLACCGLGINARKEEWLKLANGIEKLRAGMEQLYNLFQQAPVLGSLIDPRRIGGDLLIADFHELQPMLAQALAREEAQKDENLAEMGVTARGLAQAAEILASRFTLVITNVPYLGRSKQDNILKDYCERVHPEAKADLATCFVERCLTLCVSGGTTALVTPQNWLFLATYKKLRERLLGSVQWDTVARLGEHAFDSPQAAGAFVALFTLTRCQPDVGHAFAGLDASAEKMTDAKAAVLREGLLVRVSQKGQLENPDAVISTDQIVRGSKLSEYARSIEGLSTGDKDRFLFRFWEVDAVDSQWEPFQVSPEGVKSYDGFQFILRWENGKGILASSEQARVQGHGAWEKRGVLVGQMRLLKPSLTCGFKHDKMAAVIVPTDECYLPAVWTYCSSPVYNTEVRKLTQKLNAATMTLVQVPFNLTYWQQLAAEKYPNGLPKPHSDDPTQWLFNGHPKGSEQPLQVAVARLLGYRWPRQTGSSFPDCPALGSDGLEPFADADGIVCISAIRGEQPAAERLRALLVAAYGPEWSAQKQADLLGEVGGKTLEDWLRNGFFEQHCQVFHQRPFIWHIYDGLRDGFSALVNYHKLDRAILEKLVYTYLGDWIARQRAAVEAGEEGSDAKLAAALELKTNLENILEGEKPYDIFVRWKPLEKQPIGWTPDLNDGVRLNIRPFVTAGVLRKNPKVHWNKDRGKDVPSAPWFHKFKGDRINDHHLTLEEKRAVRT